LKVNSGGKANLDGLKLGRTWEEKKKRNPKTKKREHSRGAWQKSRGGLPGKIRKTRE